MSFRDSLETPVWGSLINTTRARLPRKTPFRDLEEKTFLEESPLLKRDHLQSIRNLEFHPQPDGGLNPMYLEIAAHNPKAVPGEGGGTAGALGVNP